MSLRYLFLLVIATLLDIGTAQAKERILDAQMHHLRIGDKREWSEFRPQPEGPSLAVRFPAERNASEWSLRLRRQDVKQSWKVLLNGKELGGLVADENDMVIYLPIPAGWLIAGENTLVISQIGRIPDDIRVGEIVLDDRAVAQALSDATVEVRVQEVGPAEKPVPLPCRITVVTAQGALMTVGATSNDHLAVR